MEFVEKFRGKIITLQDITTIKSFTKSTPYISRWRLSKQLCMEWDWRQPNGVLKDMVCRGLLLHLERQGYITLPPKKHNPPNPFINRKTPPVINVDKSLLDAKLSEIMPLEVKQVRRTVDEKLYNSVIERYHYLGYCHPVGEHLKYIIYSKEIPVAYMAWSSALRHIGPRDRFIGWSVEKRRKNIHLIAYNTRFLIPEWIRVKYLASHILSIMAKRISYDWEEIYNHPVYFLETFVDTERFLGTSYKAANWIYLGKTKGLGKNNQTGKKNRSIKSIWGYPLHKKFREILQS